MTQSTYKKSIPRVMVLVLLAGLLLGTLAMPAMAAPSVSYDIGGWTKLPHAGWTDGNIKGYYEGDWVPFRLDVENYDGAASEIIVGFDYFETGKNAYGFDDLKGVFIGPVVDGDMQQRDIDHWDELDDIFTVTGPVYDPAGYDPLTNVPPATDTVIYWTISIDEDAQDELIALGDFAIYYKGHLALPNEDQGARGASGYSGSSLQSYIDTPTGKQTLPLATPGPGPKFVINLTKSANVTMAHVGDDVEYTYTVTNIGEFNLYDVTLDDDKVVSLSSSDLVGLTDLDGDGADDLAPGASATATVIDKVPDGFDPLINNATVTAEDETDEEHNDTASWEVDVIHPAIDLTKIANVTSANVGEDIGYTFTILNTGDVTIDGLTLVDTDFGSIPLDVTIIAPGKTATGSAVYPVTEDALPGPLVDVATATGYDVLDKEVNDTADESVALTYTSAISVTKEADVAEAAIGETVTYTFTVENIGDTTISNLVLNDTDFGLISLDKTTLAPGENATGSATYVVTEGDLPGPLYDNATATGYDILENEVTAWDDETVKLLQLCFELEKSVSVYDGAAWSAWEDADAEPYPTVTLASEVKYRLAITNCGNVDLTIASDAFVDTDDYVWKDGAGVLMAFPMTIPAGATVFYQTDAIALTSEECGLLKTDTVTITPAYGTRTLDPKSDSATVFVRCDLGCTYTQGYWKTHADTDSKKYDDTWDELEYGEAPFFLSGQSYLEVLNTPPKKGNGYYILAHQYIAAKLNTEKEKDKAQLSPDEVAEAFAEATGLFDTYTPEDVPGDKALNSRFVALSEILDAFNNGEYYPEGPGHCDDDGVCIDCGTGEGKVTTYYIKIG